MKTKLAYLGVTLLLFVGALGLTGMRLAPQSQFSGGGSPSGVNSVNGNSLSLSATTSGTGYYLNNTTNTGLDFNTTNGACLAWNGTDRWCVNGSGTFLVAGSLFVNATGIASTTSPTISSGFGTSPSIVNPAGTAMFSVNVGTGGTATSGVVGMPAASHGWSCIVNDSTNAATSLTRQTAQTANSVTLSNFNNAGTATAWAASDVLHCHCWAF